MRDVPGRSLWRLHGSGALGATVTAWSWRWCRAWEDLSWRACPR